MIAERIVHLVDDDQSVRQSTSFVLRHAGYKVQTYVSGVEFLANGEIVPGCILLDVRMPGMDGLEVQQALLDRGVTHPVIVLTGHGDISVAVRAMRAGAVNFLEKPYERAVLLSAVSEAFARLDRQGERRLLAEEAAVLLAALTAREREVLEGLVAGLPNKTIAYDLGISPRTVEIHRANLMEKLGANSLSDALRIAFAAGLGEPRGAAGAADR